MKKTKSFSRFIKDLVHPDASRRRNAAEVLSEGDERVIYPLIKSLNDENPGVQDAAMNSLISIGSEVVAYMVIPLLREDSFLRNTAIIILRNIGKASVHLLYPLLKDKDEDIRKFGLDILADIKDSVSPEKVLPLLHDPNPNVRVSAVKAIGAIEFKDAVPELIEALRDEEWICFSALEVLGKLKDERVIDSVTVLLSSESDTLRYAAIETLGMIGSPRSLNSLMDHLSKTDGLEKKATLKSLIQIGITPSISGIVDVIMDIFKDGDWDERLIALKGLVDLKEDRSISTIIDIAGTLDPSEPENEERLFKIKDTLKGFGCVDTLINILLDPSIKYRGKVIAIEIIGELRCKEAVPYLIGFVKGDLRDVKRASIKAIGDISDDAARQTLIEAVDDYDSHVRKTAVTALGNIGESRAFNPILNMLRKEKYQDVIEEAVKTLLKIDSTGFLSHINEFDNRVNEIVRWYKKEL